MSLLPFKDLPPFRKRSFISPESALSTLDIILPLFDRLEQNAAGIDSTASLEKWLIDHLQSFLLELGKGFAFAARQMRVSTESKAPGHNSKAAHRAYAKHAEVTVPWLDDWEKNGCAPDSGARFFQLSSLRFCA